MNSRKVLSSQVILALVVVASLVFVPTGAAIVDGEPNLSVTVADNELDPGTETTVDLSIQNRAEMDYSTNPQLDGRATTARGVTVTARAEHADGIDIRTGTKSVGSISDGGLTEVPIRVAVDEDIKPGTYDVSVRLEYSYYNDYSTGRTISQRTRTRLVSVELEVRERPRFDVQPVDTDIAVGDSGPLTVAVTNNGDSTATDANLELTSENAGLTFGESASTRTHLGTLAPGEQRNVTVEGAVGADRERRNYSVTAAVDYEDEDGVAARSTGHSFGVLPEPERSFAVEGVESTLRVGEERTVSGQIRNDGAVAVDNVVLRLETSNPNVNVLEPEVALGRLGPDETASFTFDVGISDNAQPGDRQFTLTAEYRTSSGEQKTSDPLDARVSIDEQRPAFEVTGVDARFDAGSGGVLAVEIRNARDEPVDDISAKLYTESPLSSGNDEAFVQQLDPGETTEIRFALSVGGGALPKVYPAQVDFQYDDADGDTHITDTYQVPVEVTEPESGGPPVVPIVIVVVLVLALGGYAYYRRR